MQLVVPMAGDSAAFVEAGYPQPRPFISLDGKTVAECVLADLWPAHPASSVTLILPKIYSMMPEAQALRAAFPALSILELDAPTEGAADTAARAISRLDPEAPLFIANGDQLLEGWALRFYAFALESGSDGALLTFAGQSDPKWSYCRLGPDGHVAEVAEKRVVSDLANVGVYYFKKAADYLLAFDEGPKTYIAPLYNALIARGRRIETFTMPSAAMHGLGSPEALASYTSTLC